MKFSALSVLVCTLFLGVQAQAEMNRLYQPYVEQGERELEYGATWRNVGDDYLLLQRMGVGYAWAERISTEVYLLTESMAAGGEKLRGYEAELKWQLTEQGEYWADWGLLFEAGSTRDTHQHELAVTLLMAKDLGSWVGTLNTIVEYEFGSAIESEFETALRAQIRYRYRPAIEPALEFYWSEQDVGAGPMISGVQKLATYKQLRWELAWIFGLNQETPKHSLRLGVEFEF
jgi:hypothetical protein